MLAFLHGPGTCGSSCDRTCPAPRSVRHRTLPVRGRAGARRVRRVQGRGPRRRGVARGAAHDLRSRAPGAAARTWRRTERVETTPGVDAPARFQLAIDELVDACDGFLRRAAIRASLTPDERREILRGMVLTRATDNRLKTFFTGGEVRYGESGVPGQGLPLARAGSDLRRGHPAAPRRGVSRRTAAGAATSSRR